jgi:exopolysaccharide biosynthesis polyprenyl glycosylphosphotransferase
MGFTRQTTDSALPLTAHATSPPLPIPGARSRVWRPNNALQAVLEGRGWNVLLVVCDFVLLLAAVVLALGGVAASVHAEDVTLPLLMIPLLAVVLLHLKGSYHTRMRTLVLDGFAPLLSAVSVATLAAAMIGVLLNGHGDTPEHLVRAWVYAVAAIVLGRAVLAYLQRRARVLGATGKPVLIVGAGIVGAQVARRLASYPEYGLIPIGFVDDEPRAIGEVGGRDVPVLGTIDQLESVVRGAHVRNLIVAFSSVNDARLTRIVQHSYELGVEVSVVPRMFDTINDRTTYEPVCGLPLLSFNAVDPKGAQFAVKHAIDRVFAGVLLLLASPLLAAIAVAVKLSSPGPIFYSQRRVGRDGRDFDLYKFRSMRPVPAKSSGGDPLDSLLAADIAPGGVEGADRRTAIGKLLRKTSLDELPQLFNVLRGEMSIVGPRPERPEFVELFQQDMNRYEDRHRVKSGITGWAQVHGLRGQTSLAERIELDNYYIAHWSLGLDLKVLALTVRALFHSVE